MAASRFRSALRHAGIAVPCAVLLLAFAAGAEEPASPPSATPSQLDALVERVALYPDELLALVLPAATEPLQIVAAARFLDAHSKNAALKPKESWSDPVQSLLNYPDVVGKMNDDLDWTQALGEAVVNDQQGVMEAVQQVRARAKAAGNLQENPQQKVVETREVIEIHSADPEVIYVPRYDPQVIYLPAPAPPISYYPPAPCYWCPAATFGVGMMVGATTAWAFNWASHDIFWGPPGFRPGFGNDFDFDRNVDIDRDIDIGDVNIGDTVNVKGGDKNKFEGGKHRPSNPAKPGNEWKPNRKPAQGGGGQVSRPGAGGAQRPTTRPGAGGGGTQRPTTKPARPSGSGGFDRPASGQRPSGGGTAGPSTRPASRPGYDRPSDKGSFGGYERGRDSMQSSHRGSSSRERSGQASAASRSRSSMDRGSGSHSRSASSFGGYSNGTRSSAQSSRGSHSRGGGGGGQRGGGGGGGGRR